MERDTIFICHATPDDNDFVRWLGSRLTGHGYKVWADLFELRGGTPAWATIEEAIRHHACKVIFVVSRRSVAPERTGVRNELSVADSVKKTLGDAEFIIPVKIDDTPFSDLPIQVHQLTALDFSKGWGAKLIELLESLEHSKTPLHRGDPAPEFAKWRNATLRSSTVVELAPEPVVTNLLPVNALPTAINFFEYDCEQKVIEKALEAAKLPFRSFYRLIISFADLDVLQESAPPMANLRLRARVPFQDFILGKAKDVTAPLPSDAKNFATSLLRQHVEKALVARGLKEFETANNSAYYFPADLVPNNKVSYRAASGRKTNKNVVGRSERLGVNWHLAMKVNIVLGPPALVRFKPYICFSPDGQTAITDPKRSSAIRRRFCKNWWNQHWRQLQEAFTEFLSEGGEKIPVSLDGTESLELAGKLLELTAARKMPEDFKFAEEPDDPSEPEDDDEDDIELNDSDVDDAA